MYAYRLCQALGIPTEPGVVRVSLLHYNTMDEIDRLITALDEVL
jgi:selenocysteine lyase/cysteine desulfurase